MQIEQTDGKWICPDCGTAYKGISQHLTKSSTCDWPTPPQTVQSVLTGLYLSECGVEDQGSYNASLRRRSVKREALEYLCDILGFYCPTVSSTGRDLEAQKQIMEEKFGNVGEVSERYQLITRKIPFVKQLETTAPQNFQFDSLVARVLYAFKGTIHDRSAITFRVRNSKRLVDYLKANGMSEVSVQAGEERKATKKVTLSSTNTRQYFEVADEPIPGFGNKWKKLRKEQN